MEIGVSYPVSGIKRVILLSSDWLASWLAAARFSWPRGSGQEEILHVLIADGAL
jgi:hypothetical protein